MRTNVDTSEGRTMGRVAGWRRAMAERREARRVARHWQFVSDRQLRDLGLARTAVYAAGASVVAGCRFGHE